MRKRIGAGILLVAATSWGCRPAPSARQLRYVTSVRQAGPVAYRDPLGVISPDGTWIATASTLHAFVQRLAGGTIRELGDGNHRIAALAWLPDSHHLAVRTQDFERTTADWSVFDVSVPGPAASESLWPERAQLQAPDGDSVDRAAVLELSWRDDGNAVAAVVQAQQGPELWLLDATGTVQRRGDPTDGVASPVWLPDGRVACLLGPREATRLTLDCAGETPGQDLGPAFGPLAADADGTIWFARPDADGFLQLWSRGPGGGERLEASLSRDTYAPSISRDGRVLFKLQEFSSTLALVDPYTGAAGALTTFQAETPSWDPQGRHVGFTWGDWRRVIDDARYPDIAQNLGVVDADGELPATAPQQVIRHSGSEDQGLHWSPDGRWIALHSHAQGSDDVWLQPADGSSPARQITSGGSETGWPRWSPDGRWILYPTDEPGPGPRRLGLLMRVGIDPETGQVSVPAAEIPLEGFSGQVSFAEYSPDGNSIVVEALMGPSRRAIFTVPADGGRMRLVHEYDSEQWFSGIGVSPDGTEVAYIAPGARGRFQVWILSLNGAAAPRQITFDATDKTHPTWSPKGDRIAVTVFSYQEHFFLLGP